MEDLLYETGSVRRFVGLSLTEALPDETTILNFRHLLERHELGKGMLQEINAHLESQGLRLKEGTIVDASIIEAPSSTKNRSGERGPEMHQTKKGESVAFRDEGAHRSGCGYGNSTQHEHHSGQRARRDRGARSAARRGDAGMVRRRIPTPDTKEFTSGRRTCGMGWNGRWRWRPGKRRRLGPESPEALEEKREASVRAKVEHPFLKVKRIFGYAKVRCRGLATNTERLALLFGLGNLLTAEGQLRG